MTEGTAPPPLYRLRLLEVGGEEKLAYDIARKEGAPVAVVGVNAVRCRRCGRAEGDPCTGEDGRQLESPHLERVAKMNTEMARLREERGQ